MKIVWTSFLFIIPLSVFAQDYKKLYVTSKGDSIKPEITRIRIAEDKPLTYIFPNYYDKAKGRINARALEKKKQYLITDMPGQEYTIIRLNRVKVSKGVYNRIAAIESSVGEYIIEIEGAIESQEIELIP